MISADRRQLAKTTVYRCEPQSPWVTASAKATSPVLKSSSASAGVPNTCARASSNSPSHRATTVVARQLPITFTQVRPMSISSSTPKIIATPIGPSPEGTNEFNAASKMTSDDRGTPATPLEVNINANIIVICWPNDMCQPMVVSAACATNTDAIARYNVDPVRLNEYPVGITNPTIEGGIPNRSIACIAFGNADSLLVVANASAAGSRTALTNCRAGTRAIQITIPKTTITKMISAR